MCHLWEFSTNFKQDYNKSISSVSACTDLAVDDKRVNPERR